MTQGVRTPLGAALIATAVAMSGCARPPSPPPARPTPDIVLITIDTLRADRIGRGLTPSIDSLAASAVRFANARSAVPLTLPSHATILTGLLPRSHGLRVNGTPLAASVPTLADDLSRAGFSTAAFVGAYVLDHRFGLARGFATYDDRIHRDPRADQRLEAERPGADVVDAASAWLAGAHSPFFLWVHLYDPHAPYQPPREFLDRAGGRPYDGEVAYADAQVGRLLERLRARSGTAHTVVVLAGDHGEGLGDHGEATHGMLAYDSTLRVPLLVHAPGRAAAEVSGPVSLADIAPTIRQLAGVPAAHSDGIDLLGTVPADRDVFAETQYPASAGWHPLTVLAGPRYKLIVSSERELYDLTGDPAEDDNLAARRASLADGMSAVLARNPSATSPAPAVPDDAAERLRSLGYVSGPPAAVSSAAPNPAAYVADWAAFERALTLLAHGDAPRALPALADLAKRFPNGVVFQATYARALKDAGRPRDALAIYRILIARTPGDAGLFHDLAVAARAAGDRAEALRAEQAALAIDGRDPRALNGSGLLLVESNRAADALPLFERAVEADSSNASYWTNLGNARRSVGDLEGAERAYREALATDGTAADAANGIGVLLVQRHRAGEAVEWFERALRAAPGLHEARLNLGIAYQESGDAGRAGAVYREILAGKDPGGRREREAAAQLLRGLR